MEKTLNRKNLKQHWYNAGFEAYYPGEAPWYGPRIYRIVLFLESLYFEIRAKNCKHDYEVHDEGDAENGPRMYGVCKKCKHTTDTWYGF